MLWGSGGQPPLVLPSEFLPTSSVQQRPGPQPPEGGEGPWAAGGCARVGSDRLLAAHRRSLGRASPSEDSCRACQGSARSALRNCLSGARRLRVVTAATQSRRLMQPPPQSEVRTHGGQRGQPAGHLRDNTPNQQAWCQESRPDTVSTPMALPTVLLTGSSVLTGSRRTAVSPSAGRGGTGYIWSKWGI